MKFRDLRADEIECRVGVCRENGLSLLLYKDARCDARILDEQVGPENWQNEFYECKGTLFCKVGILVDRGEQLCEWVWKDDAGSPSNMEAAKGEASDAFKRACFKWGIGRELYTAPFIWIPADKVELAKNQRGNWYCKNEFRVAKIAIENGRITGIRIVDANSGAIMKSWKEN